MNFLDLARSRGSVRSYVDRAVEPEKLEYILECARMAPSAVNRQPWRVLVIVSAESRKAVQQAYNRDWFRSAPLYLIVLADDSVAWTRAADGRSHADIDAAIITEHICLAAADCGMGSCWVCNFDPEMLCQGLDIRAPWRPVAIVPIGYAAVAAAAKQRKTMEDIVDRI